MIADTAYEGGQPEEGPGLRRQKGAGMPAGRKRGQSRKNV